MNRFKKKILQLLALTIVLSSSLTVNAAPVQEEDVLSPVIYDMDAGGKQTFEVVESDGDISYITITELPPMGRVYNGTYNIEQTRPGNWTAGFNVVVSGNRFTSVYGQYCYILTGSIVSDYLSLDSSAQASYTFVHKISSIYTQTGLGCRISGGDIHVFSL